MLIFENQGVCIQYPSCAIYLIILFFLPPHPPPSFLTKYLKTKQNCERRKWST